MTETIEVEKLVRYNATDGDILVLTAAAASELSYSQREGLQAQMSDITKRIKRDHGKDVSSIILPHGFKLELINVGTPKPEPRESLGEAYTVGAAAIDFAKEWEHESSSAYRAAEAAFIAGYEFKVAQPVAARCQDCDGYNCDDGCAYPDHKRLSKEPPKTGLHIGAYLLQKFYTEGKDIRRACWPPGDHISTDGAEGGTLWYYTAKEDLLVPHYRLSYHELGATDWEIV